MLSGCFHNAPQISDPGLLSFILKLVHQAQLPTRHDGGRKGQINQIASIYRVSVLGWTLFEFGWLLAGLPGHLPYVS